MEEDLKKINVAAFMDEEQAKKAGIFPINKEVLEPVQWIAEKIDLEFWKVYEVCKKTSDYSVLSTFSNYEKKRHFERGKVRITWEPNPLLKLVQSRINSHILSKYPRHQSNFGFSGGFPDLAIMPHLSSNILFSFDIKHAFPNTRASEVLASLKTCSLKETPWNCQVPGIIESLKKGVRLPGINTNERTVILCLPKGVPEIITQICTFPVGATNCEYVIPQGAPTSPRLFDLVMRPVDEQLSEFMKRIGGVYTRYADNFFCSIPDETLLSKIREEVLNIVRCAGRGESYKGYYKVHKIRVRDISKQACRMLGLNIMDGKIYNTRDFKRRLRAIIFYLGKTIENKQDPSHFLGVLHGMMGFVKRENLTPSIEKQYQEALKLIRCVVY